MKFDEIELQAEVLKNIKSAGFEECTPIQEACIPHIISGKDIAGLAQTGTGKTATFVLPMLNRVVISKKIAAGAESSEFKSPEFEKWKKGNFILVLVPTRELAEQVSDNVKKFSKDLDIGVAAIYGGTSYDKQKGLIKEGVEFVVATPGRLIDLYKEHELDLGQVRGVIFDEADRMFDMGFKDDMKFILHRIPKDRQFLVFSATLNFDVLNVAYEFGADPLEINVSKDQAKAENVKDEIFHVGNVDKPAHLLSLLKRQDAEQVIIFSNFKRNVEKIAKFLTKNGLHAVGISSLLSQSQRQRVMESFKKEGGKNILVATDVAARGLDVKGVDLVINYELPDDPENYVHRIGRTGRAGTVGSAYSLVGEKDVEALSRIENYVDNKIEIGWLEDSDLVSEFEAFPADDDSFRRSKKTRSGQRDSKHKRGGRPGDRSNKKRDFKSDSDKGDKKKKRRRPSKKSSDGQQHRDRMNGRHDEGKDKENKQQRKPKSSNKKFQGKHSGKRNHKAKRPPRKNQRGQAANQPQSLGKKVSSFIKRLFG